MRLNNAEWAKLVDWISKIKKDLQPLLTSVDIFSEFAKVVDENGKSITKHTGWLFCNHVAKWYVDSVSLGIRRHAKRDKHAISLLRLLDQLHECAHQVTFDKYLQRFPREARGPFWQRITFDSLSDDGQTLSQTKIALDAAQLKASAKTVEQFVDRTVAHLDPRGTDDHFTYGDLAQATAEFDRIACKHIVFLTGDGYESLKPVVQFDWQRVFDFPLRKPRKRTFGARKMGAA